MNLLEYIPHYPDKVKRQDLEVWTGLDDRVVRAEIERLRKEGTPICNFGDGEGYFVSYDKDHIARQYKIIWSRLRSMLSQAIEFDKMLVDSQMEEMYFSMIDGREGCE